MTSLDIRPLDLPRRGMIAVSALVAAVSVVLALVSLDGVDSPLPALVGLALFVGAAAWTALAPGRTLPAAPTVAAVVTPLALSLIVGWPVIRGGYTLWHLGASAFLLLLVALRGRLGAAWLGMTGLVAGTLTWGALSDFGIEAAAGTLVRQVAILVIGTVFVFAIGATQRRLGSLAEERGRLAAEQAAARAADDERIARLRWARALSSHLLEAIAERERLDPALRLEAALVEAELRDGLRARSLAAEPVTTAAREARRRGVEVVLIDDRRAELGGDCARRVRHRAATELDATSAGRAVIRVLPEGRSPLATIVVDGPEARRTEILDEAGHDDGPAARPSRRDGAVPVE